MANSAGLPSANNYITTHTPKGESVFLPESVISSTPIYKPIPPTASLWADLYQAPTVPVAMAPGSSNEDVAAAASFVTNNAEATATPGTSVVFRRTDTPPGGVSPMHRTLTLDYGIIMSGEVELVLESGEKRLLRAGDTLVQRATMHQWRNPSKTEWCRMAFIMMPTEELDFNGKKLEQEFRVPGAPVS